MCRTDSPVRTHRARVEVSVRVPRTFHASRPIPVRTSDATDSSAAIHFWLHTGAGQGVHRYDSAGRSEAPRKRRHTAHRIYIRIRAERPEADVSESTVRRYVSWKKRQMGAELGVLPFLALRLNPEVLRIRRHYSALRMRCALRTQPYGTGCARRPSWRVGDLRLHWCA
jgi:hypothetical protein